MRSLVRLTLAVMAALVLGVAFTAQQNAFAQASNPGVLVISEFRFSGPGGGTDEYIEVCNVSGAQFTVQATDGSAGVGIYTSTNGSSPVLRAIIPNGTVLNAGRCYLATGTPSASPLPATAPGAGYTLTVYEGGGGDTVFGSQTSLSPGVTAGDIPDDTSIAIFSSTAVIFQTPSGASTATFCSSIGGSGGGCGTASVTLLDAVGFTPPANPLGPTPINVQIANLFKEGTALSPMGTSTTRQHAWVRRNAPASQAKQDSGDNAADFFGSRVVANDVVSGSASAQVATRTIGGVGAILGAPGPEGTAAPRDRTVPGDFSFANFDTGTDPILAPNRERIFAAPNGAAGGFPADNNETTSPRGTFAIRGTYTNTTSGTVRRLRFRIVEIPTVNRGLITTGDITGQSILRLISSTTRRVFVSTGRDQDCTNSTSSVTVSSANLCGGSGFKLVQGLALEGTAGFPFNNVPNTTTNGGGVNSAWVIENNQSFTPNNGGTAAVTTTTGNTNTLTTEGSRAAGTPAGGGAIPSSAFLRGTGTLILGRPLANNESVSVEFRFGVELPGRFVITIVLEADAGATSATASQP